MTEQFHFHFSLSCIGEGNGNPLQCSCLENPRDGGACWAALYGVAQSRTQLKRLSSTFLISLLLCTSHWRIPGGGPVGVFSSGSSGPGIYLIPTSQVSEGNCIRKQLKEKTWVLVHSTPTWRHFSLTPFLIFKWEWKLNSLGTESSPGFSLGKLWRQPFGCEDGASKDFLKLNARDKCTGLECLWADEGATWDGQGREAPTPPPPRVSSHSSVHPQTQDWKLPLDEPGAGRTEWWLQSSCH